MTFTNVAMDLPESQAAYRLDDGRIAIVQITRLEVEPGKNDLQPSRYLALKVRAWLADEQGSKVNDQQLNCPCEIDAKVESISASALAEGTLTIPGECARMTTAALNRLVCFMEALKGQKRIPVEGK